MGGLSRGLCAGARIETEWCRYAANWGSLLECCLLHSELRRQVLLRPQPRGRVRKVAGPGIAKDVCCLGFLRHRRRYAMVALRSTPYAPIFGGKEVVVRRGERFVGGRASEGSLGRSQERVRCAIPHLGQYWSLIPRSSIRS